MCLEGSTHKPLRRPGPENEQLAGEKFGQNLKDEMQCIACMWRRTDRKASRIR